MLPVLAVVAMGAMKKFSSMGGAEGEGGASSMLKGLLDKDGDGEVMDDLVNMAKKFMS